MMLMHLRNLEKRNQRTQKNKWRTAARIAILSGMHGRMIFERCLFMKKLTPRIKWRNEMKYQCKQCDFKWIGTSNTFDQVHEHEKTHLENNKIKTLGMKTK